MTERTLARARAGDEDAFRELTDPYRRELQLHIYRIVGSAQDAEDLLQETLLAAWRGLEQFEGARVGPCLAVPDRDQPLAGCPAREPTPPGGPADDPDARADTLERAALARALPRRSSRRASRTTLPDRRRATRPRRRSRWRSSSAFSISRRSSARCSCCATCSGYRAGEVAEMLETSEASVNSLLRRARAAFESRLPATGRERAPLPELQTRARHRRPLRRNGRERRHRRNGRPPDRRRVADDATPPARLPGTRRDRRVPAWR